MTTSTYEDGDPIVAGIHIGRNHMVYTTFIEKRVTPNDDDFFLANGLLSYDTATANYFIETPSKTTGETYEGTSMIYTDSTGSFLFEGKANFINPTLNPISINASVLGTGNRKEGKYSLDAMISIDLKQPTLTMELMAKDMVDIIERLGNAPANDVSIETLLKLGNMIGELPTRAYEKGSMKDYMPLTAASPLLNKSVMISGVKMQWSDVENAWYNTTKLGISNIGLDDINAKVDGFLEFKKDETGGDVMNLFIQAAPGSWYYFNFQENALLVYSSNSAFNTAIAAKSNYGQAKPGELVLIAGDEAETLKFLNTFRRVYFGISDPYQLVYPEDIDLDNMQLQPKPVEDEKEEEVKDDGFGF
jgi:hypothetical protein